VTHWALTDGRGLNFSPMSEQELVEALRRIDAAARRDRIRVVAILTSDIDGEVAPYLSLVLGDDESVIVYETGDDGPEGGFSKGPYVGDKSPFPAVYGTGHAEYQRWMVVPSKDAYLAAQVFFRTSARPASAEWGDI
jgi:hypothetical protein